MFLTSAFEDLLTNLNDVYKYNLVVFIIKILNTCSNLFNICNVIYLYLVFLYGWYQVWQREREREWPNTKHNYKLIKRLRGSNSFLKHFLCAYKL